MSERKSSPSDAGKPQLADRSGLIALGAVIPRLRGRIQLTGFIVLVVVILLFRLLDPNNVVGQLAGGYIGVSLLLFPLLFNFLRDVPEGERASLLKFIFVIFAFSILCAMGLLIYAVTRDLSSQLSHVEAKVRHTLEDHLEDLLDRRAAIESSLRGDLFREAYPQWDAKRQEMDDLDQDIERVRSELQPVVADDARASSLSALDYALSEDADDAEEFRRALDNGNFTEAEQALGSLEAANADRRWQLRDGRIALRELAGDIDGALKLTQEYTREHPREYRAWLALGRILQVKGDYRESFAAFQTVLDDPSVLSDDASVGLRRARLEAVNGWGVSRFLAGDLKAACVVFDRHIKEAQDQQQQNFVGWLSYMMDYGMVLGFCGRRAQSLEILAMAAKAFQEAGRKEIFAALYGTFNVTYSVSLLQFGRFDAAAAAAAEAGSSLEKAGLSGHVQFPVARQVLSTALLYNGDIEGSRRLIEIAKNTLEGMVGYTHPRMITAWQMSGIIKFAQGMYTDALQDFRRALHIAWLRLGRGHFDVVRPLSWYVVTWCLTEKPQTVPLEVRSAMQDSYEGSSSADWLVLYSARLLFANANGDGEAAGIALNGLKKVGSETDFASHGLEVTQVRMIYDAARRTGKLGHASAFWKKLTEGSTRDRQLSGVLASLHIVL